jgi:hypothetical protein
MKKLEEVSDVQVQWSKNLRELLGDIKQGTELDRGEEDATEGTEKENKNEGLMNDFPKIKELLREPLPFGFRKLAAELTKEFEGSEGAGSGEDTEESDRESASEDELGAEGLKTDSVEQGG